MLSCGARLPISGHVPVPVSCSLLRSLSGPAPLKPMVGAFGFGLRCSMPMTRAWPPVFGHHRLRRDPRSWRCALVMFCLAVAASPFRSKAAQPVSRVFEASAAAHSVPMRITFAQLALGTSKRHSYCQFCVLSHAVQSAVCAGRALLTQRAARPARVLQTHVRRALSSRPCYARTRVQLHVLCRLAGWLASVAAACAAH